MDGESRAADILNKSMLALLALTVVAAALWGLASEFAEVRGVYNSLSAEQHRHLTTFGGSLLIVMLGAGHAVAGIKAILASLKRPRA